MHQFCPLYLLLDQLNLNFELTFDQFISVYI